MARIFNTLFASGITTRARYLFNETIAKLKVTAKFILIMLRKLWRVTTKTQKMILNEMSARL